MKIQTLALATVTLLGSASAQAAGEWTWLAGGKPGYEAKPTLSLLGGQMDPGGNMDSGFIAGIELSLNCPLLQPPTNRIRQQLSYVQYDENGTTIDSIEINPHYVVEVAPGLEVGGGPGLGYVMVETPSGDGNVFGLQLGVSAHYRTQGPLFLGAEARYQFTTEDDFGGASKDDLNNWRVGVKVGFNF